MSLEIEPVDPLDPAQDDLLAAWLAVAEAAERAEHGDASAIWSADEKRALYRNQHDERLLAFAARLDGVVAGHLELELPAADNTHRCDVSLAVHPDHRRRGVGSALLALAGDVARAEHRSVIAGFSDVSVEHDDPAAGFAARHGFVAEQRELRNELALPLPAEALTAAIAEAHTHANGYEVLTSWDGIPDEWLSDRAELSRRMSTDAPKGGVDLKQEDWDAGRVRRQYEVAREQGRRMVESVARHCDSGRLVAFTNIAIARHTPDLAYQWDTLVLGEHRGHRLGLLLKAINLRALSAELPDVRRILTWNAADNEPMLRVNRALGFQPIGHNTTWQKRLH